MKGEELLSPLPASLRAEVLAEFRELIANFHEGRWRASGLNAGRFCEIVYCILRGLDEGDYPSNASKPPQFRATVRQLEQRTNLPKSFRFIIPALLDVMYEVRNNRNVSHVSSTIDPSFMDANFVVANVRWIMAELVRYYHTLPAAQAQSVVDTISQYSSPYVWSDSETRRVLHTGISLDGKILLLLSAAGGRATRAELFDWLDESSKSTFNRRVSHLHTNRMIEAKVYGVTLQILPPGVQRVAEISSGPVELAA